MIAKRPRITGIQIKRDKILKILSQQQMDKIHEATLTVIEEVGVRFPSEKALKIFADVGADVDFETQDVKISSDLLMDAVKKAPRSHILASRSRPEMDLVLDGNQTYFRNSGVATKTVDLKTREVRASKKSDIAMMAKVADYLPMMSYYWPIVSAQDKPSSAIEFHELEASILNTEKHVQTETVIGEKQAKYTVEMATVLAGDSESLKERPPISVLFCPIDPLAHDKESIEAALVFAEAGIPVTFDAMPTIFSTSPGTLAGALVVGNAELLSGIALLQLQSPGTPVCYFMVPALLNPQTGGYAQGNPYAQILSSASVELGHYYNLPTCRTTVLSDASEPGLWQIGKDAAFCTALALYNGSDLAGGGLGLLENANLLYPEQILFDHQILEDIKIIAEGIKVDSEGLAIDEIMAVGPRGNFLTSGSTKKNLRALWQPSIAHQISDETDHTFRDPREVTIEKIKWIVENHSPKPPPEGVQKEIRRIVEAAERELS